MFYQSCPIFRVKLQASTCKQTFVQIIPYTPSKPFAPCFKCFLFLIQKALCSNPCSNGMLALSGQSVSYLPSCTQVNTLVLLRQQNGLAWNSQTLFRCQETPSGGVYEIVVGRQRKKKGVFSRERQGSWMSCQKTTEKRGPPTDGNE